MRKAKRILKRISSFGLALTLSMFSYTINNMMQHVKKRAEKNITNVKNAVCGFWMKRLQLSVRTTI